MPRYLSSDAPKELEKYTINADDDKEVPDPDYGTDPIPYSIRKFLPYAPKWTTWPDYQRVSSRRPLVLLRDNRFYSYWLLLALH